MDLDPAVYIPGVRGYYSLPDGRLASMPFNSSTSIMWVQQGRLRRRWTGPGQGTGGLAGGDRRRPGHQGED